MMYIIGIINYYVYYWWTIESVKYFKLTFTFKMCGLKIIFLDRMIETFIISSKCRMNGYIMYSHL